MKFNKIIFWRLISTVIMNVSYCEELQAAGKENEKERKTFKVRPGYERWTPSPAKRAPAAADGAGGWAAAIGAGAGAAPSYATINSGTHVYNLPANADGSYGSTSRGVDPRLAILTSLSYEINGTAFADRHLTVNSEIVGNIIRFHITETAASGRRNQHNYEWNITNGQITTVNPSAAHDPQAVDFIRALVIEYHALRSANLLR